jgi:hypothetical protein
MLIEKLLSRLRSSWNSPNGSNTRKIYRIENQIEPLISKMGPLYESTQLDQNIQNIEDQFLESRSKIVTKALGIKRKTNRQK